MKTLSLQWRLTLMTASLVTAACLLLNLLVSTSAVSQLDGMESYILEVNTLNQESLVIDVNLADLYPHLPQEPGQAKSAFLAQSIAATLAVILLCGACTYFLAGRALAPLRRFSARIERVQAQNLAEPLVVSSAHDEIARLTRAFNDMLSRLNEAFTAQRQFSANAAHELRTPLAVISTRLDVLRKRPAPTAEAYADALHMVSEQTERLSHLVGVLLEMTELQTAERNDRISLGALCEEVLCDLAQVAQDRGVTLLQEAGEAALTGSDPLVYRAVYNLTENAIKYNRPGGTVSLSVRTEGEWAVVTVTDTGMGIAPEDWARIFEPFVRVDKSRSRAMGGAGLGLALVRDIARLHGGSVQIVRSSREGTQIALTLPSGAPEGM